MDRVTRDGLARAFADVLALGIVAATVLVLVGVLLVQYQRMVHRATPTIEMTQQYEVRGEAPGPAAR